MSVNFHRLVRFKDSKGAIRYGEALSAKDLVGQTVKVYEGETPWELRDSNATAEIAEVLCPLTTTPIVYGVGLNYKHHIEESGFPTPKHPVIFTKTADSLAGPYEDVPVHPKIENLDYEGELCVIIGKDLKNFQRGDDPLKYVLGYSVGNDVSSRYWQNPERSGNQHGKAKDFDKFTPLGPLIVSPQLPALKDKMGDGIPDLRLKTSVNGEERQNSSTSDLLFTMTGLLEFLSMGRTVRKGSIIMTGTPSGVAAFMKPPAWLKSGDVVDIDIEELGNIANKMVFE